MGDPNEPGGELWEGPWIDCWQCGGEGHLHYCIDGQCQDAESGCDLCKSRCDICRGKGGWPDTDEYHHPAAGGIG